MSALTRWRERLAARQNGEHPDKPSTWIRDDLHRAACEEIAQRERGTHRYADSAPTKERSKQVMVNAIRLRPPMWHNPKLNEASRLAAAKAWEQEHGTCGRCGGSKLDLPTLEYDERGMLKGSYAPCTWCYPPPPWYLKARNKSNDR